jgi:signal transduction histidine kinase
LSVTEIESDETVHYGAFIRDISEKTRLQAQLLETERLAAIGSTAAKIGHELANPLNGMSLTIQLLEQHLARLFKEPAAPVVAIVKRLKGEISRLNHLVGEFRTISRKDQYELRPTELGKLIEDIAALQGPHLADHGIELERSVPANLPVIAVDSDKIKQALLNLIKNAAEAMPDGGKITLDVSATSDRLVVQVGDSGTGVDPDIDPFEPFVTTKRDGTGIGLVIVRQIVTAHGGTISYRSQPNVGTTFEIALPLK